MQCLQSLGWTSALSFLKKLPPLFAPRPLCANDEGCFVAFLPLSVTILISALPWWASLGCYQTEEFLIMCAQWHTLSLCVVESGLSTRVCYSVMQRHKARSSKQLSNRHWHGSAGEVTPDETVWDLVFLHNKDTLMPSCLLPAGAAPVMICCLSELRFETADCVELEEGGLHLFSFSSVSEAVRAPVFRHGTDKNGFSLGCSKNFRQVFGDEVKYWPVPVFSRWGHWKRIQ